MKNIKVEKNNRTIINLKIVKSINFNFLKKKKLEYMLKIEILLLISVKMFTIHFSTFFSVTNFEFLN